MSKHTHTRRERDLIDRLTMYREEAINNESYRKWRAELDVANKMRAGKEYPEEIDPSVSSGSDPYLVFPYICDMGDRLTAMITGGRLVTRMVARGHQYKELVDTLRSAHVALQENANLKGYLHTAVSNCVWGGIGWNRWYLKSDPMFGALPYVENIDPSQCWISPMARDPFDRLLGSHYWGHETIVPKKRLMLRYPKYRRYIEGIDSDVSRIDFEPEDNDPAANLISGAQIKDQNYYSKWSEGRTFHPEDYEYLRFIELIYQDDEIVDPDEYSEYESEGITVHEREQWRVADFVVPLDGTDLSEAVIVRDEALPYRGPNVCGISSWLNPESAYSLGALSRGFDAQYSLDVLMSILIKSAGDSARLAGILMAKAGAFSDPEQLRILQSGDAPSFMTPDIEPGLRLQDVVDTLKTDMPNFGEFQALITMNMSLIERLTGVNNIARGEVSASQRISSQGIKSLLNASLSAQDTPQMHVNAAVTHNGRILLEMMQRHMVGPMNIAGLGGRDGNNVNINQPIPVDMIDLLDSMLMERDNPDTEINIPNALRVYRNDETVEEVPVDFGEPESATELIDTIMNEPTTESVDIIVNDISVLDVVCSMEIDGEYREVQNERIGKMQAFTAQDPTRLSRQTQFEGYFEGDDLFDWDLEQERILGDSVAQKLNAIKQLPPEAQQQVDAAIAQAIAQTQQQMQGAPTGQQAPPQVPQA